MMRGGLESVADVIDRSRRAYDDDPAALEVLDTFDTRLREPLRIAVAGIVKAGKSTLLNALIGERIAPTDAGECTRTVMWYRYGRTPQITLQLMNGERVPMPVKRVQGDLQIELGEYAAEEIDWIGVEWPSEHLRRTVLIDTPGIASLSIDTSAQATRLLTPASSPTEADAIIYMLRHLHAADIHFLEAFNDTAAGRSQAVNALAILSRADELGSGRIDSLISAAKIADRYRRDGELRALTLDVVPVAGLLAEAARTMNESEFTALREISLMDRDERERLLLSVDRFVRRSDSTALGVAERRGLLDRFGIFGIRLAAGQLRAGAKNSTDLSERLVQQSGLVELQRFINDQFRSRAVALKTRGVLQGLELLVREKPIQDAAGILGDIEQIMLNNHELRELGLLARARTSSLSLNEADRADAERIVGGSGTSAVQRLGLPETAGDEEIRARADDILAHWHGIAESPLADRATAELGRVVIRSVEGAMAELLPSRGLPASDVVLTGTPAEGLR
ncbi:dynamin family protein [Rathayibacter sp. CAU 1779]